jgi:hypothetical protein
MGRNENKVDTAAFHGILRIELAWLENWPVNLVRNTLKSRNLILYFGANVSHRCCRQPRDNTYTQSRSCSSTVT